MKRFRHICASTVVITLLLSGCSDQEGSISVPGPVPQNVDPPEHSNDVRVPIEITGFHFITKVIRNLSGKSDFTEDDIFLVQLKRAGHEPITLSNTEYINTETLRSAVPPGIPVGNYALTVTTPYGLSGTLEDAYLALDENGDTDQDSQTSTDTAENDNSSDSETEDGESCGGMAIWSDIKSDSPLYSVWDGTAFTAEQPTLKTGPWRILEGASSPLRDEVVVLGIDSNSKISGMMWDGNHWAPLPFELADVDVSYYWAFSVGYEQKSGDCMIVWNNGDEKGSNLSYRVWNGSHWSDESTVKVGDTSLPRQMVMASNPLSDEFALVINKQGADYALIWDGNSWGNILLLDDSSGDTDISVSYEQISGRAMVVYGKSGDANGYSRIWNGLNWGGETTISPPKEVSAQLRWSALAADPSSNRLAFGAMTFSQSEKSHTWLKIWNGTSWIDLRHATSEQGDNVNYPNVAVAFVGRSGRVLATYAKNTTEKQFQYLTWSEAAGWSAEADGPKTSENANTMKLYANPASDDVLLLLQDSKSHLYSVVYRGTDWASPFLLEYNTGETKNQPFTYLRNQSCP